MTLFSRIGLALGTSLMAGSFLAGALVPQEPAPEIRTVDFPRSGPCSTCGHARPITLVFPDGTRWPVTEPGSVQEMGLKYCPVNQTCKVVWH